MASDAIVHGNDVHAPVALMNVRLDPATSSTTMFVAVEGPRLLTMMLKMMLLPATTVVGAVFVIDTSAAGTTVAVVAAVLFPGTGSVVDAVAVTAFVIVPLAVAETV